MSFISTRFSLLNRVFSFFYISIADNFISINFSFCKRSIYSSNVH